MNIFAPLAKQFIEQVREDVCILVDIDQFRVPERRSLSLLLLPAQRHSLDAVSLRAPTYDQNISVGFFRHGGEDAPRRQVRSLVHWNEYLVA